MSEFLITTYADRSDRDSYFWAITFDPDTREIGRFVYDSTACGSMGGRSLPPGASQEVKELYYRVAGVRARWEARQGDIETARRLCLGHYSEARRLRQSLYGKELQAVEALLKVKNFRSAYRKSLADQVRGWLQDDAPKFKKPLSRAQLASIMRD